VAKEDKAIDHFMEYVKIFIRKAKVCQEWNNNFTLK
jgi:hypothetical protein